VLDKIGIPYDPEKKYDGPLGKKMGKPQTTKVSKG
jgi:hypothetical protein